ncbi:CAP domain-containing protein [Actinoplanes sp. TRM 88003]|uniref:CAP domain-containing protein n=1 Tax=Paractinoplanes aksuensis TaxID=2939490 RepID=A0ABT1DM85_9ACTN|nr:CAP domain-containing protein [Actinoplanes aksuensis]MCO8271939.1 CAP domain-containing protein [Actinoplanes aksuensis]
MRSSITKRLALIAMIPATLLVVIAFASSAQAAVTGSAQLRSDIATLTNQQRAAHGCKAVVVSPALTRSAQGHSAYQARTNTLSHAGAGNSTFVTRTIAAGYNRPLSENVAFGFTSAAAVVNGWMASPGHRANILNCKAITVGVGVAYAANGTPYFTQEFGY